MSSVAHPTRAIPRHAVAVHGSLLGAELRTLLRSLGYCPAAVADTIDHVGVHGTAAGAGSPADPCDVEAINGLVVKHTAHLEYESAYDWPAVYGDLPDDPEPFEPDPAERLDWTILSGAEERIDHHLDRMAEEADALSLLTAGLMPVSGGSPAKLPKRAPVTYAHKPQPDITDYDHFIAHGCV